MEVVEVRCTEHPSRMFAKLLLSTEYVVVPNDNLMEFACRDCAKRLAVQKVLHRFDISGALIETEIVSRTATV